MFNEQGQGCVEYALVLLLVVIVGLIALAIAGGTIVGLIEDAFNNLDDTMRSTSIILNCIGI